MMAEGMSIEDCVETIAATLPICLVRGVAYSTFTIIRIACNEEAEIIQYNNPHVIQLRDGQNLNYNKIQKTIGGKKIFSSKIKLQEGNIFVAMSDGCPHAGVGSTLNFGWQREEIISFLEPISTVGYTAKTLLAILLDEVNPATTPPYAPYACVNGSRYTCCLVPPPTGTTATA